MKTYTPKNSTPAYAIISYGEIRELMRIAKAEIADRRRYIESRHRDGLSKPDSKNNDSVCIALEGYCYPCPSGDAAMQMRIATANGKKVFNP